MARVAGTAALARAFSNVDDNEEVGARAKATAARSND